MPIPGLEIASPGLPNTLTGIDHSQYQSIIADLREDISDKIEPLKLARASDIAKNDSVKRLVGGTVL